MLDWLDWQNLKTCSNFYVLAMHFRPAGANTHHRANERCAFSGPGSCMAINLLLAEPGGRSFLRDSNCYFPAFWKRAIQQFRNRVETVFGSIAEGTWSCSTGFYGFQAFCSFWQCPALVPALENSFLDKAIQFRNPVALNPMATARKLRQRCLKLQRRALSIGIETWMDMLHTCRDPGPRPRRGQG